MQVAIDTISNRSVEIIAVNGGWTTVRELGLHKKYKARNGQLERRTEIEPEIVRQYRATQVEQQIEDTEVPAEFEDALPRTKYSGPMLALRAAAKSYTRPANGNPCCGDGLAEACGAYTREVVVKGLIAALNLPGNPYLHLNPGQQSMNLRNKTRQALKAGAVTLEQIESALNVAYITSPEFKA